MHRTRLEWSRLLSARMARRDGTTLLERRLSCRARLLHGRCLRMHPLLQLYGAERARTAAELESVEQDRRDMADTVLQSLASRAPSLRGEKCPWSGALERAAFVLRADAVERAFGVMAEGCRCRAQAAAARFYEVLAAYERMSSSHRELMFASRLMRAIVRHQTELAENLDTFRVEARSP